MMSLVKSLLLLKSVTFDLHSIYRTMKLIKAPPAMTVYEITYPNASVLTTYTVMSLYNELQPWLLPKELSLIELFSQ